MKIQFRKFQSPRETGQTLVLFVTKGDKETLHLPKVSAAIGELLQSACKEGAFTGKRKESIFFRSARADGFENILAIGMGPGKSHSVENARVAGAATYHALKAQKVAHANLDVDSLLKLNRDAAGMLKGLVEGLRLASYEFTEHKSKLDDNKKPAKPSTVWLSSHSTAKALEHALAESETLAEATNFARWLGDHAANTMTPTILAKTVSERAKGTKVKVTVWDKARIAKEKMGGLISVAAGSDQEPRFIIMEYTGAAKAKKPVYFVGKGLTFDSGGISIKPSAAMDEMKYDMCGAAAVIGTVFALEKLKAKVNVVAVVPATENMPGPSAVKPGDIMIARNGKTVEVLNTDAEGRLVLADALVYANEQNPQAIVDAATLTGAIVVALGNTHTGVFTRDNKLMKKISSSAETAGELVWQLPVTDDHLEDMKGTFADLSNISSTKGAGSATAAAFLQEFVNKDMPYAHFDIAGTAWNVNNRINYAPKKGASGVMVRTFVELAKSYF
jgi:leucyl aminopeptidase